MTNDALINMNKVQKHLKEIADNARDNGYSHEVEVIQSIQDNLLNFVEESRTTLAPVDVDAGLRALDYQRDLAFIFMVAKGSKDYDETIGDRIERVQELILQLKKQNDYLAARGFGGAAWNDDMNAAPDGFELTPQERT